MNNQETPKVNDTVYMRIRNSEIIATVEGMVDNDVQLRVTSLNHVATENMPITIYPKRNVINYMAEYDAYQHHIQTISEDITTPEQLLKFAFEQICPHGKDFNEIRDKFAEASKRLFDIDVYN